jgi:hypothetical protein
MTGNLLNDLGIKLPTIPDTVIIPTSKNVNSQMMLVTVEGKQYAILLMEISSIKKTAKFVSKGKKSHVFGVYSKTKLGTQEDLGLTINGYLTDKDLIEKAKEKK